MLQYKDINIQVWEQRAWGNYQHGEVQAGFRGKVPGLELKR